MAKLVSQVYAEALFGLGVENGLLDTLLEELNGMCEILGKNPQFVTLLGHPELDQKKKIQVTMPREVMTTQVRLIRQIITQQKLRQWLLTRVLQQNRYIQ